MKLTLLILVIYAFICCYGIHLMPLEESKEHYLTKDHTNVIKGLCCIIVIFVHIPVSFGNSIQDAIGSFAYICVTLFFMISAYGLGWNFENKSDYAKGFIKHRIPILLIPFLLSCLIKLCFGYNPYSGGVKFVYVLLIFYIFTYIAYTLPIHKGGGTRHMLCSFDLQFGWLFKWIRFWLEC